MDIVNTLIISIVEGLTEYLPVSSTAHMIFTFALLHIKEDAFAKVFILAVQMGAILAVVVCYWHQFFNRSALNFYAKLLIAVLPALFSGALLHHVIENWLEKPVIVAILLIIGGVALLFVDEYFNQPTHITEESQIDFKRAFIIGCWQCLALIPGVSRSAASIVGGMQQNLSRSLAAEFSFFLAVPTMCAATLFSLLIKQWDNGGISQKGYQLILSSPEHLHLFLFGFIVAFIVAILSVRVFIGLVRRYGFKPWGWYRIIAGCILLCIFIMQGAY